MWVLKGFCKFFGCVVLFFEKVDGLGGEMLVGLFCVCGWCVLVFVVWVVFGCV